MKLKKIRRPDKKPFECVMDEKYSILFASKFFIDDTLNFEVNFLKNFDIGLSILSK